MAGTRRSRHAPWASVAPWPAHSSTSGTTSWVASSLRPCSFGAATAAGLSVVDLHEAPISRRGIESNPVFALYPDLALSALERIPWLFVLEATKP